MVLSGTLCAGPRQSSAGAPRALCRAGIVLVVGLCAVMPAGTAWATDDVPPPSGIYFCYADKTVSVDNPVIELPVQDRTVLFPSGVYTSNPPC